jgi:hypothetical protein
VFKGYARAQFEDAWKRWHLATVRGKASWVSVLQIALVVLAILLVPAFIWLGVWLEQRRRR